VLPFSSLPSGRGIPSLSHEDGAAAGGPVIVIVEHS
jgi:hypothetical protein